MPLKVFNADGSSDMYNILRAIYCATQRGARVINLGFSLAGFSNEFARAISFAEESGVICVASAGNSANELLVYPAALRNVLSVASTGTADVRSTISNYGSSLVYMAALGESIISTYPGQHDAGAWGTSFSAPMVAGAAALCSKPIRQMLPDKAASSLGHGRQGFSGPRL